MLSERWLVTVTAGDTSQSDKTGGAVDICAGDGNGICNGCGGHVVITAGQGYTSSGGSCWVATGYGAKTSSGNMTIATSNAGTAGLAAT